MKLYRYRSITSKNLARTFTHCELYFTSPTDFNDPFDCRPPFSTDYTQDDLRSHFRKAIPSTLSRLSPATLRKLSDAQLEAIIEEEDTSILLNDSFESRIAKPFINACLEENSKLGVLCLSKVHNDILMWSNYGGGHRGIVLQFDKSRLESDPTYRYCKKVDYKNNIITLHDMNINVERPDELARLLLFKKTDRLQYEREWRIIVDPGLNDIPGSRIFKFPKLALTGVIFGWKMSAQDKYAVNMWLKDGNHEARIYQATSETSSYSLRIDPPINPPLSS